MKALSLFFTNDMLKFLADQALLYEFAQSLAVRTFLRMRNLPFTSEKRRNAPYISPTGLLPVLQSGSVLVSGFDAIVEFIGLKDWQTADSLSDLQAIDVRASCCYVMEMLLKAEVGIPLTINLVTYVQNWTVI
ncbi:unnamed protein product [Soboliphyme baturini]|uniref:Thioredoxin-like_fold domain-containing protein n=1 Tax=Soboliphyme baturini TaxID=241478 RepID=A0A183J1C1_9BILA|nr:unnamed protein product [Soboliphyme baturini]